MIWITFRLRFVENITNTDLRQYGIECRHTFFFISNIKNILIHKKQSKIINSTGKDRFFIFIYEIEEKRQMFFY